jgi:hypothetical protein
MCTINPCQYCVKIISLLLELKYTDKILFNLGNHYYYHSKYKLTEKYYLMAIEKGNLDAMLMLGIHYNNKNFNCVLMKKYFLMGYKYKYSYIKIYIIIIYCKYKSFNYYNCTRYKFFDIPKSL